MSNSTLGGIFCILYISSIGNTNFSWLYNFKRIINARIITNIIITTEELSRSTIRF